MSGLCPTVVAAQTEQISLPCVLLTRAALLEGDCSMTTVQVKGLRTQSWPTGSQSYAYGSTTTIVTRYYSLKWPDALI
jgi:hypothetical protein